MNRKDLIQNDGYWMAQIEMDLFNYKGNALKKHLTKNILKLKNELINSLNEGKV